MSSISLADKYLLDSGTVFMTGVQALVRLPLEQHRVDRRSGRRTASFLSGYPGSPLGGYDLELGHAKTWLASHQVVFNPAVNEELAATAVMGSQLAQSVGLDGYDGVVGIWYGKGPGLDRATDAIRHANFAGTSPTGGAIALVGDDPAAKSSTIPFTSEAALVALAMPVLAPGNVQEVLDFGRLAIALSRFSGLWVGVKIATSVADGSATVDVDIDRLAIEEPPPTGDAVHVPTARLVAPTSLDLEASLHGVRMDRAAAFAAANRLNRVTVSTPHDRLGIAAPGKSWYDLQQALRSLGLDTDDLRRLGVRLFKIGCVHPLDTAAVREFASGLNEILVIEDKLPLLERAFRDALYAGGDQPVIVGKRDPTGRQLLRPTGELDADAIAEAVAARIGQFADVAAPAPSARAVVAARAGSATLIPVAAAAPAATPGRTPYFCSGCPHNVSTRMDDDALVGAGIGCSGMVMLMPSNRVGTLTGVTQMGGEGAQWIGMAPFTTRKHMYQNLGDGTFFHSGSLAVRAAVASGVNMTYKLLVNGAVAMTGGQDPVGGTTVEGMCRLLATEGVRRIIVTTDDPGKYRGVDLGAIVAVRHRDDLADVQRELEQVSGITVLLHDQQCAAEARRDRKRGRAVEPPLRILINERICEGCGDCGDQANCLSLVPVPTDLGRKTQVNQASCNKDYTCLKGDCPAFIEVIPAGSTAGRATVAELESDEIAPPTLPSVEHGWVVRIAGMGGTGVVTTAQVLGTAGLIAGLDVVGLDQTGMAQKGGPVVSDLKFARGNVPRSNRAASGEVDAYIGADLLVAADAACLRTAAAGRTAAVVSTTAVPTGAMVTDPTIAYPSVDGLRARIDAATTPARNTFLDASHVAASLLGSDQFANTLLLGVAYQAGLLPVTAADIEQAVELNGVAVAANLQAFRRGRQAIADPAALAAAVQRGAGPHATPDQPLSGAARKLFDRIAPPPGSELDTMLRFRIPDLIDYQHARWAGRYVDLVELVQDAERRVAGEPGAFTTAVARYFYKLLAYKDEYEIARLALLPDVGDSVTATFGDRSRSKILLHPPVLRSLGLQRKLRLGSWFRPALGGLRAMRRVRGTRLDPFGRSAMRRLERDLIDDYESTVAALARELTLDNLDLAVQIAELPDVVRGYEDVKLRNVAIYRERLAGLSGLAHAPARTAGSGG